MWFCSIRYIPFLAAYVCQRYSNFRFILYRGVYSVLAFSLLGPIAEELFFRQWVISYLTKYNCSNFAKMLVSSMSFCLIHLLPTANDGVWIVPYWRIDTLLFGILQYWVFVKTRDVRYCIIIHVVCNLCARFVPLMF